MTLIHTLSASRLSILYFHGAKVYYPAFSGETLHSSRAHFSKNSHSSEFNLASIEIKRFLKLSLSSFKSWEVRRAISEYRSLLLNMSPEPSRSHSSFTLNSRQIKDIIALLGILADTSYLPILALEVPILSANCCCVNPNSFLSCFILSFIKSPHFLKILYRIYNAVVN